VSTNACPAAGLGLDANRRYYMRVQGADDEAAGRWSNHSEITLAPGPGLLKAAKKKRRK
jgi:hypothetical protein